MTTDKMDLMKRTASSDMQENFEKIINEIPLKVETARLATALFFVDNDYVKVWNKKLDEYETYLPKQARQIFLSHLNNQYSKLITEKIDPISRVFVRSYNKDVKYTSWFLKWPQCLVSNFKDVGSYGAIEGVPRSGKTSLGCLFMEVLAADFGIETLTNIKIKNPPGYIHQANVLSELVQLMYDKKRWICVLDETATFADKKTALKTENIDFENLARFIGKMGGRLLMITHSYERDIPSRLQDWMTERYKKISITEMECYNFGKYYKGIEKVKDIPLTTLQFVTEDITSLKFDISIELLLQEVQGKKTVTEALKNIEKYKNKSVRVLEYYKKHPEMSGLEISRKLNVSKQLVYYHVGKFKNRIKGK
jgi:hypothetical protein